MQGNVPNYAVDNIPRIDEDFEVDADEDVDLGETSSTQRWPNSPSPDLQAGPVTTTTATKTP